MSPSQTKTSKFLSLILRHRPETVGLSLDPHGWVSVKELLDAVNAAGHELNRDGLEEVVRDNDKQRFAFSDDGHRIRASQGHSVSVDLELKPTAPPGVLYHGTVDRFLDSIRRQGLIPVNRQHVHLSADRVTAEAVGRRRGAPVILTVNTAAMAGAGHLFYLSDNGVWLTPHVPAQYLTELS